MDIHLQQTHETLSFAKDQLVRYLTRMSAGDETLLPEHVELGVCEPLELVKLGLEDAEKLNDPKLDDAYVIEITHAKGFIYGSNARSVLLGVYRYLTEIGCRFLRPGHEYEFVPVKKSAEEFEASLAHAASMRHRGIRIEGADSVENVLETIDWLPKVGYNSFFLQFKYSHEFLRRWYEVPPGSIAFGCRDAEEAAASGKTWFPYNKGGKVRRWYGNHLWVVNYRDNGTELRSFHALLNQTHSGGRLKNADTYFRRAVTWQFITEADRFGVRLQPEGFLYDVSGSCLFPEERDFLYVMGLLSSPVASRFLELFNPTMNFQPENLRSIPFVSDRTRMPEIEAHVRSCIALAQEDWDLDAESWDFAVHPLVHHGRGLLADAWEQHAAACRRREGEMQAHESALAGIFAEIYGLEAPAAQAAPTLRPCRRDTAAAGLIEFAAGCMLGRYHMPAFAEETAFLALSEIPATLERFLAAVMGGETAAENVEWLSDALGMPLDRWCMTKLYPYHLRHFRKRPVFWLATSGRKHAVHGLVNYHRMGESPVPLLMQTAEQAAASPERDKYLERLASLAGERMDPDAGIPANHARFRSIFAAI